MLPMVPYYLASWQTSSYDSGMFTSEPVLESAISGYTRRRRYIGDRPEYASRPGW